PVTPKRFGWRMPAAWLLFALALCAKPSVVVVPVVWLLFVRARDGRPTRHAWSHFIVLIGLAIAVAGIARFAQPAGTAPSAISLFERAWISIDSLGFYVLQVLAPSTFCPDYGRTPEWVLNQGLTTASIVGLAYIGLLAIVLIARKWRFACILMVFPAILGPVLGLLPFGHQQISTVTDRYAYVAMIAPAFLVARLVVMPRLGRIWPMTLGLFALYIPLSFQATLNWSDTTAMWENVLIVNPRSGSALTNLGFQHEAAGREEQAIEFYERAIAASPTNALAYNNIGNIHFRANRLDQAQAAYKRARIANSSDLHSRNNLGAVNRRRGNLKAAEALFREVIAINPRFAPAFHNLGLVEVERDAFEQAERSFRSALEIDPGFGGALRSLAGLLAKLGDEAGARGLLSRAIGVKAEQMEFELAWSRLLIQTEREPKEIRRARLKAVELGCRDPQLLVELGRGLHLAEQFEQAEPVLRLAMEHAPLRIEPRLDLAQILEASDRWEEFRSLIVETVRDFSFRAEAWQNLAIYHLHTGDRDKATEAVRTALKLNPNFEPSLQMAQTLDIKTN
ncbi:MAG: tetratricopeptide (TPR) repeat protein, partial [Planctomycetota bacterium]